MPAFEFTTRIVVSGVDKDAARKALEAALDPRRPSRGSKSTPSNRCAWST